MIASLTGKFSLAKATDAERCGYHDDVHVNTVHLEPLDFVEVISLGFSRRLTSTHRQTHNTNATQNTSHH